MSTALRAHRAVIEAGPGAIRRLCCGTVDVADSELSAAALGGIDDPVALVGGRPIAVDSLWSAALRSLDCGGPHGITVVHPSWWSASRVGVIAAAARMLAKDPEDPKDVVLRPRSWLLTGAWPEASVVVEIADRIVAVAGAEVAAVPRRPEPRPVAEDVAALIAGMAPAAVVLIDAPSTVAGTAALAGSIAGAVRGSDRSVVEIDDARLTRLARTARTGEDEPVERAAPRSRAGRPVWLLAAGVVVATVTPVALVGSPHRPPAAAPTQQASNTFLVEGRVVLTIPANWPTQRVVTGPGSARVQVTSPSDPEVALHVTQSAVAGETLSGTAERLRRAIDAEPAGVFVDFEPAGVSAGRPAVTYRELRAAHHVRWTILLDGAVRISVGCQSRPGAQDAVREVCDEAVRSAHAVE